MEELSDFCALVHRHSELLVDVRPAREGQAETGQDAFKRNARIGLRGKISSSNTGSRSGASPRVAPGQMWKYEGDRLISMGGERDSLVLTAQWVETPGAGLQKEGGRWELILCNAEGSMNHTAHQHWLLCADGTVRLSANGMVLSPDREWSEDLNGQTWPGLTVRKYEKAAHSESTWLFGNSSGPESSLLGRFTGCLLGLAVGDSLGSSVEGWAASEIAILHPTGVRELAARNDLKYVNLVLPPGHLTDRSSMAFAVAASLVEMRDIVAEHVAQRCAEFFAVKAINGHGPLFGSTAPLYQDMIQDRPHRSEWPAAPFRDFDPVANAFDGCGATYRSVPVGLACRKDGDEGLREKVCRSVLTADADYEAAFMTSKAIALLSGMAPETFDARAFLSTLMTSMERIVAEPLSLGWKLASNMDTYQGVWKHTDGMPPSQASASWYVESLRRILGLLDKVEDVATDAELAAEEEAAGLRHITCAPFPGRAIDTLPASLWHFALRWRTPRECLVRAAASGGDTATIASLTGALLGTLHGVGWLNKSWFDSLDNGLHGRDYAIRTAALLHDTFK